MRENLPVCPEEQPIRRVRRIGSVPNREGVGRGRCRELQPGLERYRRSGLKLCGRRNGNGAGRGASGEAHGSIRIGGKQARLTGCNRRSDRSIEPVSAGVGGDRSGIVQVIVRRRSVAQNDGRVVAVGGRHWRRCGGRRGRRRRGRSRRRRRTDRSRVIVIRHLRSRQRLVRVDGHLVERAVEGGILELRVVADGRSIFRKVSRERARFGAGRDQCTVDVKASGCPVKCADDVIRRVDGQCGRTLDFKHAGRRIELRDDRPARRKEEVVRRVGAIAAVRNGDRVRLRRLGKLQPGLERDVRRRLHGFDFGETYDARGRCGAGKRHGGVASADQSRHALLDRRADAAVIAVAAAVGGNRAGIVEPIIAGRMVREYDGRVVRRLVHRTAVMTRDGRIWQKRSCVLAHTRADKGQHCE